MKKKSARYFVGGIFKIIKVFDISENELDIRPFVGPCNSLHVPYQVRETIWTAFQVVKWSKNKIV